MDDDKGLRRPPKQERSRERVDEILSAAKRLIGEKGVDAVKMRDIAAETGGPISSIYQYFPNKSAIIARLFSQLSDELTQTLDERLESVDSIASLEATAHGLLDYYFMLITSDPSILDLLNAVQADKTLKNIDIHVTRQQAQHFCEKGRPFVRPEAFEAFNRVTFMLFQLAISAVRLALALPVEERRGIMEDYKTIIDGQLSVFARPDATREG